ncbi:MAG: 4Fe-4S binding protein [Oscillospiraceae bacterium]
MAGTVTFRRDRCKGCELCTLVCPKHIIIMDQSSTNRKGYHPATVRPRGHGATRLPRQLAPKSVPILSSL